ncbi:MAG: Veg family protein [Clostridia bacterium]|nr:Veg family protein [Clostridia bacterium]
MREIVYSVSGTKDKIKNAIGLNVKLKVNRGRNKIEMIEGILENAYPNIFTVRLKTGSLVSFSYSDVITKHVKFM